MSKTILYQQCLLQKGSNFQTSWIPQKFAIKGKYLKLKDDNGWKVISVAAGTITEEKLKGFERDYLNQRKVSDI